MKASTTARMPIAEVEKKLLGYDIITFDVFDTLITRCVPEPTDVFEIVAARCAKAGIQSGSFVKARRQSEQTAYDRFGDKAGFSDIYDILHQDWGYTAAQCETLMALELETELDLIIPRKAVRELVKQLLSQGKRIILCSDMYLSGRDIRCLLERCGYPADLELWVSNEIGATKQSGDMWKQLFPTLPAGSRVIHVGDNEDADYRSLKRLGKEALLIGSSRALFRSSELYGYLSGYASGGIGDRLVLGYLVNKACYNSPFEGEAPEEDIVSVWGGGVFACFMDFLTERRDDSQLLFATREGYLLKPMYERYCAALGIQPQSHALFYSSRAAASAATITSEEELRGAMRRPDYSGTLGSFAASRLNFDLSSDPALFQARIELPRQTEQALKLLRPYFPEIFQNAQAQKTAYRSYIGQIRQDGKRLKIVDVGYNGTIQHAVSKILGERVDGLYIFLNDSAFLRKSGNGGDAIAHPNSGDHPVYYNLLFLEAVMQVPYGQLQKMELRDGAVTPTFNQDANFSGEIPAAQERFCEFAEWIASWKKKTGSALQLDFALAEAIWVCLLKFDLLPASLLEGFWLADDFGGHPLWKYDPQKQQWQGNQVITPLAFSLIPAGTKLSGKQKLKLFVKRHIPDFAFDWAKDIWTRFIK